MSRPASPDFDAADLPAPVCDFCGFPIVKDDQECVARGEGVCAP